MSEGLDKTDRRILEILQRDARISNIDLAERVNLSPTPCARRVRRLEEEGYIKGSMVILDPEKLGLSLTAYIGV